MLNWAEKATMVTINNYLHNQRIAERLITLYWPYACFYRKVHMSGRMKIERMKGIVLVSLF